MKHTERNKIFSADDKGNKTYKQSGRKNHNSPLKTIFAKGGTDAGNHYKQRGNNNSYFIYKSRTVTYGNIINKLKVKQNMKYHHDYYKNSS